MTEFTVLLSPGEDGFVVATCAELPGCISQGRTKTDALVNIKEAIQLCLEAGDTPAPAEVQKLSVAV